MQGRSLRKPRGRSFRLRIASWESNAALLRHGEHRKMVFWAHPPGQDSMIQIVAYGMSGCARTAIDVAPNRYVANRRQWSRANNGVEFRQHQSSPSTEDR